MGEITALHKPIRIELDSSEELRSHFNAAFLSNVRANINLNSQFATQGSTIAQGNNEGTLTPTQSNELLCDVTLPMGENISIGAFKSDTTKEIYWFNWNSLGNHNIWVSNSETNTCRKVYEGECLNFQFPSQFHLPPHRVTLYVVYDQSDTAQKTIKSKFLVWTDGYNWQGFLDVETSIATNGFDAGLHPYYRTYAPYCDICEFIQLGVRPPINCPKVLPFDDDTQLQFYETPPEGNNLKEKVWYFRTDFVLTDGRHSVMSPISTATFIDGGDCKINAEDIKCFRLVLDAGSALVEKIRVYFSNDGINWFLYDTIDKWEDCDSPPQSPPAEFFWERQLALKNYYLETNRSPPCQDEGCFSTFKYSWSFAESPDEHDLNQTISITINGVVYSHPGIVSTGKPGKLIIWLNSLGFGTFEIDDYVISISSASEVFGNITLTGGSPPDDTIEVEIEEIEQCGDVNTFIYQFCGNKQCQPISPTESNRIFDELPIVSVAQTAIDNQIAFADNLTGYDNFLCAPQNITITAVQDDAECETELVKITIDAVIYNAIFFNNTPIYEMANSTDIAFGGLGTVALGTFGSFENEVISAYQQQIKNPQKGFIGGFRGTNFKVVSQQYHINDLDTPVIPANVDFNAMTKSMMKDVEAGNYFIQRWVFTVPKGNYIFEIYSHLAEGFDDCVGTSTYFWGVVPTIVYNVSQSFGLNIEPNVDKNVRELLIEACDGDVTYSGGSTGKFIVIADLTKPRVSIDILTPDSKAVAGYLKEKDTNTPVELAQLHSDEILSLQSFGTDHNGFYFATNAPDDYTIYLRVLNPDTCALTDAHNDGDEIDDKALTTLNLFVDNPLDGLNSDNFNNCGHEIVTGTITDCEGNPLAGVPVVLTRTGLFGVTDTEGVYRILAHDNANIFSQNGKTRKVENVDSLVISQSGACLLATCDTSPPCNLCIPITHINWISSCFDCISQSPPETAEDIYNFTLQIISGALTGVKTGGTYAVSIIGYDHLDRNNFVQRIGFFSVPTIMSNGVFAPYHFEWNVGQLNLQSWVKKIRFAIRGNDYQFLLSWVANKIEFLDAAGNITSPSIAANIKLYIDGLNEFNTVNFFNTNTNYQFVEGDRIRFITNGDQSPYLTTDNNGIIDLPISSLENGNSLLIPYDSRLQNLEANSIFELYRVPICETEPIYNESCPTIPVLFNEATQSYEPVVTSGTIPFWDVAWFFRSIPQKDKDGFPTIFLSPHRYEHNSVSDYWGDGLFSIGRAFVRNENSRQTWLTDEVVVSDVLNETGIHNGLSTFKGILKKNYFTPNCGAIVAIKAHTGLLFILYESYYDVVNIAQNLLMITAGGNVQANADYLGNRPQKIAIVHGCALEDTSTIVFHNEFLFFADVRRTAWCKSNYVQVWDVTKEQQGISSGNARSYFIEKFKYIAQLRLQNQFSDSFMFLHSAYDPYTDEIILTSFARGSSPPDITYVNHERDYDVTLAETISFSVGGGYFSGTYSFTPERMINFGSGANGNQFVTFSEGRPFLHHVVKSTGITYMNFYSEQAIPVCEFVFNGGEGKGNIQKRFLAIRVMCKQSLFFSDKIWTQAQQFSQLPIEEFEALIENYSEAGFLCDINTVGTQGVSALVDGDSLSGDWIKIRLLIDPNNIGKYFEIEGFLVSSTESF